MTFGSAGGARSGVDWSRSSELPEGAWAVFANVGDWLVIRSSSDERHARRALILAVHEGGVAPYTVRWLDTGHEGIVFPGPDAEIVTAAQQAELDRHSAQRSAAVQDDIARHG